MEGGPSLAPAVPWVAFLWLLSLAFCQQDVWEEEAGGRNWARVVPQASIVGRGLPGALWGGSLCCPKTAGGLEIRRDDASLGEVQGRMLVITVT